VRGIYVKAFTNESTQSRQFILIPNVCKGGADMWSLFLEAQNYDTIRLHIAAVLIHKLYENTATYSLSFANSSGPVVQFPVKRSQRSKRKERGPKTTDSSTNFVLMGGAPP